VDDGEQRDRSRDGLRSRGRWRLDGDELAAGGAVDDVPPAGVKLGADGVGGGEIALTAPFDARLEESLSLGLIRSFWL
jgi:hypothetical protein